MARATRGDNTFSGTAASASSLTYNVTCTTNSSTMMAVNVITARTGNLPATPTSVTIGGEGCYMIKASDPVTVGGVTYLAQVWFLLTNPWTNNTGTGSNAVIVTLDSVADLIASDASTILSPRQGPPEAYAQIAVATPGVTAHPLTFTTLEADTFLIGVIAVTGGSANTLTAGAGTTQNQAYNTGTGPAHLSVAKSMVAAATSTATPGAFTLTTNSASAPTVVIGAGIAIAHPSPVVVNRPVIAGQMMVGKTVNYVGLACFPPFVLASITQQWYRRTNGVEAAIGAATATTYTLQAADLGAGITIFCRVTPVNASGTGLPVDTADVTVTTAAGGESLSVNLASFLPYNVYPHEISGDTTVCADIALTMAFNNNAGGGTTPTSVQWRVLAATISSTGVITVGANAVPATDGTFNTMSGPTISGAAGTITGAGCKISNIPVGGWYILEVRTMNGAAVLYTTRKMHPFGVGDHIVWDGSSTADKAFSELDLDGSQVTEGYKARMWDNGDFSVPGIVRGCMRMRGTGARAAAARLLEADPNRLFLFIPCANGGTKLHNYNAAAGTGWAYTTDLSGNYQAMIAKVATAPGGAKIVHGIFQKSDSITIFANYVPDAPPSTAAEVTDNRSMFTNVRTAGATGLANANVPFFVKGPTGTPAAGDLARYAFARTAINNVTDDSGIYLAHNSIMATLGMDLAHLTPAENRLFGACLARSYAKNVLSVQGDWRPPRLTVGAEFTGKIDTGSICRVDANFTIFNGSKIVSRTGVLTGITGFELFQDVLLTLPITITAAYINSATTVRLEFATATPIVNLQGRYLYNNTDAARANAIYDNGSVPSIY